MIGDPGERRTNLSAHELEELLARLLTAAGGEIHLTDRHRRDAEYRTISVGLLNDPRGDVHLILAPAQAKPAPCNHAGDWRAGIRLTCGTDMHTLIAPAPGTTSDHPAPSEPDTVTSTSSGGLVVPVKIPGGG